MHRSECTGWVLTKMADGSAGYSNTLSREQMVHAEKKKKKRGGGRRGSPEYPTNANDAAEDSSVSQASTASPDLTQRPAI